MYVEDEVILASMTSSLLTPVHPLLIPFALNASFFFFLIENMLCKMSPKRRRISCCPNCYNEFILLAAGKTSTDRQTVKKKKRSDRPSGVESIELVAFSWQLFPNIFFSVCNNIVICFEQSLHNK